MQNYNNIDNLTYNDLFELFKQLNKKYNNFLTKEILFEFIVDNIVFDKLSFISNRNNISLNNKSKLNNLINCLEKNIPWERVLKYSYFYNQKIVLFDHVFSPRKDTEILVDKIIKDYKNHNYNNLNIYDLGSGTGCISVALVNNLNNINITNFEKNINAYKNTLENTKQYKNIKNINIDYLTYLKKNKVLADIIVCNPPYINWNYKLKNNVYLYDPKDSLFADDQGLFYYKEIITILLKSNYNKVVYFEIGYDQKTLLEKFLISNNVSNYEFIKDLNNIDRVLKVNFFVHNY